MFRITLCALLLAGCSTQTKVEVEDRSLPRGTVQGPAGDGSDRAHARTEAAVAGPAVVALLAEAREHGLAGDGERAVASLERALRIEPENPWLWHRLAVLRLQQSRWDLAISLARKSSTLAGANTRLQAGNWEVISRAERGRGHDELAEQAERRAQELFGQSGR